jgi:hypothetical protein
MVVALLLKRVVVIFLVTTLSQTCGGFQPLMKRRIVSRSTGRSSSTRFSLSNNNEENSNSNDPQVRKLLQATLNRAQSTLSSRNNQLLPEEERNIQDNTSVDSLFQSAISRAQSTLASASSSSPEKDKDQDSNNKEQETPTFAYKYRGNPAITNFALAHSLWSSVLRPNIDSAIDATCGNGQDSIFLAKLLFGGSSPTNDMEGSSSNGISSSSISNSQLLCIDIQQQACESTTRALAKELPPQLLQNNVQVLQTSHAPLPRPRSTTKDEDEDEDDATATATSSVVGLVVYNLGYLPRSGKACVTQMDSTLASLVDAILLVRIFGMISVLTYPNTNPDEDIAVRVFLECVALLSSNNTTWNDFLDKLYPPPCNNETAASSSSSSSDDDHNVPAGNAIRELVQSAMQRVISLGDPDQTWRVSEHRKLGMDGAPILLTATRIK